MDCISEKVDPHKSSLGKMDANILALLCYLGPIILAWIPVIKYLAWAAPLVVFFIEKESVFVKFHAMQAILLSALGAILVFILSIAFLGSMSMAYYGSWGAVGFVSLLATLITIAIIIFEIIAMVKAYGYTKFKIPLVGNLAAKISDNSHSQ